MCWCPGRELSLEFPLILWTLKTLETGLLTVRNHRVHWDGEWLPRGYCLNGEILREEREERREKREVTWQREIMKKEERREEG